MEIGTFESVKEQLQKIVFFQIKLEHNWSISKKTYTHRYTKEYFKLAETAFYKKINISKTGSS